MTDFLSRRRFLQRMTAAGGANLLTATLAGADTRPAPPDTQIRREANVADYEALTQKPTFQMRLTPHWLPDNQRFWYRKDLPDARHNFVLINAQQGQKQPAFDHARLAAGLSLATVKPCAPDRLPFDAIAYTDDGTSLLFAISGAHWQCDLATYVCAPAVNTASPDEAPAAHDTSPPAPAWTPFLREHNIWARHNTDNQETPLTTDGTPEHPYRELRPSPDGQMLAAFRASPVPILPVYMVESSPPQGFRGVLHSHEYAQPGDPMPSYELCTFDIAHGTAAKAQIKPFDLGGIPEVHWRADNTHLVVEQPERGHQRFRLWDINAVTGHARAVIDEQARTFINTSNSYTYYTQGASQVIYASEQDGWRHLYLYDIERATLLNQITQGEWVVRGVDYVDEATRELWFHASGRNAGEDPYHIHHYKVNFDGTGLIALTNGDGTHDAQYSPNRAFLIDTCSRIDLPPVHTVRRTSDGSLSCELEHADIHLLTAQGWQPPQVFHAKGRDGKTDIWGMVCRPRHMEPGTKYPIIENIYAGPQDSFVRKSFAVHDSMQSLAELGFIVVQCDGMGTRNRSKAFHDVCWHNIADAGLPDRIAWIRALGRKHAECDTSKVGIYGTSAGGQSAAGALLFHPEFYSVGVASCGCHDNRIDKQWWNEQWMGYPVGPWYADNSNITHADKLRGKLFLMVGELDTNVPPESTLRFADALIEANKDFDLLVLPGMDHTNGGAYGERRRRDYFIRHLLHAEPPDRNIPVRPVTLETQSASGVDSVTPVDGGEPTTVRFVNDTAGAIELFWLPGDGTRHSYGTVGRGETRTLNTYAGHAWLVVQNGTSIALFTAQARPGIATVWSQ